MRKIESLQPNECIHIRNEKEAKRISKMLGLRCLAGGYVFEQGHVWVAELKHRNNQPQKILPASDFLPKKKSKYKRLKRRVEEALKEQPKEIDFSVPGQLVEDSNKNVFCSTGVINEKQLLVSPIKNNKITYKSEWVEISNLNLYTGEITLSNNLKQQ